jgi:hypothetical protein
MDLLPPARCHRDREEILPDAVFPGLLVRFRLADEDNRPSITWLFTVRRPCLPALEVSLAGHVNAEFGFGVVGRLAADLECHNMDGAGEL